MDQAAKDYGLMKEIAAWSDSLGRLLSHYGLIRLMTAQESYGELIIFPSRTTIKRKRFDGKESSPLEAPSDCDQAIIHL